MGGGLARRPNRRPAPDGLANATINPGDRVAIIGRSGSGKSVLLRSLLIPYRRALLLDPKRRADFGGWAILEGARDTARQWPRDFTRAIARPSLAELTAPRRRGDPPGEAVWMGALCWAAYLAGSCAVAADELAGIATEDRPVPELNVLLQRGRDPGPQGPITTLVATQRPRHIPLTVISEAEHVFAFDLNLPDDRAFLRDVLGAYERPRVRHGFWYWTPDLERAIECDPLAL